METVQVHLLNPQPRTLEKIANVINSGGVVLLPGDTAYFLAVKIGKKSALEKLNLIKQTKKRKFYSVVFRDLSDIAKYADIDNRHFSLLKRCLPGPYTFILNASRDIPKIMLENRREIGIRIPDSVFISKLIEQIGEPLIVSTASNEDGVSFNDPAEDAPAWLGYVDMIVDGGYIPAELTTIIRLNSDEYEIVREGKGPADIF
ncbi:MAG TPA: L-threonylcarbamoyladenylate synthase [bacterium]|nr:L-threonylcarbamoyladenylate synthase [bacterium]HPS29038.1 L-threonylcarbamoyladenylate synthase [bacterium]